MSTLALFTSSAVAAMHALELTDLAQCLRDATHAAEIQAWVDAHGSARTRAGLRRGHCMDRTIAEEVIAWAYGSVGPWCREYNEEDRDNPSDVALAALDAVEALGTHPWLHVYPRVQRADILPGNDDTEYTTGVVVDVTIPGGSSYGFLLPTE